MVTTPRRIVGVALALGLGMAGASACKVINPDHCANQALPGNEYCASLSRSTPYCSPCVSNFHGCVSFEPLNCNDYDQSVFEGDDDAGSDGATEGASDGATTSG